MKIDFGWREYTPEWGKGEVRMEVRPLTVGALLRIAPIFESDRVMVKVVDKKTGQEVERPGFRLSDTLKMAEAAADIFPDHVRGLTGIIDNDGKGIEMSALWVEGALVVLAVEIMVQLMAMSNLGGEVAGN